MFQFIFLTDSLCGLMALFFSASSRLTTVKYTDQVIITSISQIDPVTDDYENRCTLKDKSSVTCVQLNGYYIFVYFLHSTYLLHVKLMVSYCIYKNVTHRY